MHRIKDLDGNEVKWLLTGSFASPNETKPRSKLHLQARELIHEIYPASIILEEVQIPINKKQKLYLDFYLKIEGMAVEVQGQQHFEFTPFYHKSKVDYYHQMRNDKLKADWCEFNGIILHYLKYNEDINEWRTGLKTIKQRLS